MSRNVLAGLMMAMAFSVGCRRSSEPAKSAGPGSLLHPATLEEQAPATYRVRFSTTKGDFVIEVTRAWAPLGADRFYNLVKNGFYTNASFFRLLPGFVVQFGLSPNPRISNVWQKATLRDDPAYATWDSGLIGPAGRLKPAFSAFRNAPGF